MAAFGYACKAKAILIPGCQVAKQMPGMVRAHAYQIAEGGQMEPEQAARNYYGKDIRAEPEDTTTIRYAGKLTHAPVVLDMRAKPIQFATRGAQIALEATRRHPLFQDLRQNGLHFAMT